MKKFFSTKKNKTIVSVIAGIALAGLLSISSSYVANAIALPAAPLQAENFIGIGSTGLMSRIGSLTVGSTTSAPWITSPFVPDCATTNNASYTKTCLAVEGTGTFSKLWVSAQGLFMDGVIVSTASQIGGGGGGEIGWLDRAIAFAASLPVSDPAFLIHDISGTTEDSMLISGLGYFQSGNFAPRNLTTERDVCAAANGKLIICTGGGTTNPINGSCGMAAGHSYQNPPTNSLCGSGTASAVTTNTGSGTYNWTCAGSNGGTTASCQATISQPAPTYSWYIGSWGSCSGGSNGSCSGSYQGPEVEADWNGNPFNWSQQYVYDQNRQAIAQCPYYDMAFGNNINDTDGNGGGNANPACLAIIGADSTGTEFYWVDNANDSWQKLTLNTGVVTGIIDNYAPLYDSETMSCVGPTTQSTCELQNNACTWNPGSSGTQTRTVQCRDDSTNIVVADSYCIPPAKPITSQSC